MQLQDLSVELVQLILTFVQPRERHALLFSCKFLNILVQPLIYEDVGFHLPYSTPERPQPLPLLQHLLRHPERGSLIKHIRLPPKSTWIATPLGDGEMETLAERGTRVIDMAYEDILAKFQTDGTGTTILFVILLFFCPNLESFAICDDLADEADYYYRVNAQEDPSAVFSVRNVSTVEYSRPPPLTLPPWHANQLFSLPRLQYLKLKSGPGVQVSPPPPKCPSLTRLILREVYLRENYVGLFLDSAPNLKYLTLELLRHADYQEFLLGPYTSIGGSFLDCSFLKTNIANSNAGNYGGSFLAPKLPRCQILEGLTITTGFVSDEAIEISNGGGFEDGLHPEIDGPVSWGIKGSLGSLKEFKVLKTLEVPLPVLLGWHVHRAIRLTDHLPDSLVELTFRADLSDWGLFEWEVEAVKDLIEAYAGGENRGSLKVLKYLLLDEDIRDNEGVLIEIHDILARVGIRFEVMKADPEY